MVARTDLTGLSQRRGGRKPFFFEKKNQKTFTADWFELR
jgi:hypothetical protein